jgi:hypothetical protein
VLELLALQILVEVAEAPMKVLVVLVVLAT